MTQDPRQGGEAPVQVAAVLAWARAALPEGEALPLLVACLGRSPAWVLAHGEAQLAPAEADRLAQWVARRTAGEPLAYLAGERGFWTFDLAVGPAVLIPREDTETLVRAALACLPPERDCRVADLGTGSGAIALALACERPRARVVATDASAEALACARANAARLGVTVDCRLGHWCRPLAGERYDLIASNPPYLAEDDPHQHQGDLRFEPRAALVSGADGLDALRELCACAPAHLVAGGWLLLEHGWQQGDAVRALLAAAGLQGVRTLRDFGDRERVSLGRMPE
jgi:release factor glutamine methyltransferase